MNRRLTLTLLLAAAVCPYFVDLGGSSIWDANEAFYVETPRQMVEAGDYIFPTFNGQPRENKPVLSYWIVAAFYQLFGISVAVERVAIALGALATIAATFLIGRALSGAATGVLAALIFATAPRVVRTLAISRKSSSAPSAMPRIGATSANGSADIIDCR